jgi:hypothetical protein
VTGQATAGHRPVAQARNSRCSAAMPSRVLRYDRLCGDSHQLWTADGRISQQVVVDDGDVVYQPRPVAKLSAGPNPGSRARPVVLAHTCWIAGLATAALDQLGW